MAATNPNPGKITDAMWRLWTDRPVTAWKLGGFYADKRGYHNDRKRNQQRWPGNYSIKLSLDLKGPDDKIAAVDFTMSDAEMRKRTRYLIDAADRNDPRLYAVREFYGTLDGKTVVGRIKDTRTGKWRSSSADITHLWHIHVSFFRAYVSMWNELSPILSVLRGETLAEWESGGVGGSGIMLPREGDSGPVVEYWQRMLKAAGYDPGPFDGDFGPKTKAAITAIRKKHGLEPASYVTAWTAMTIQREVFVRAGAAEPPPTTVPTKFKLRVGDVDATVVASS